jgi:prepilin-type N-terminal cleavage/methylation domain-containing protein
MLVRKNRNGFTLIELVLIITLVSVLAVIAVARYISLQKEAERAVFTRTLITLSETLNMYSLNQLATNQTVTVHNPFTDLSSLSNYAGTFPDVDGTNCPAGYWAYQSGNASNGNWAVVIYRPKATLTQAFVWGGMQWIIYDVTAVQNASGKIISLTLTESAAAPPLHIW